MGFLKFGLIFVLGICMVMGGTHYIAIPIDGIDFIELNQISPPSSRHPRQTETYVPLAVSNIHSEINENPVHVPERRSSAHILDYVDFGAHTGANGAYSWFADYPSHH
ncbi:uncharacterized protein LOC122502033 [Leptopilina heterotoma]|uniref:uncharacterized protein LOC122502033 n=1 Tax=Leptopilina heterotoma TaxID=63436 RepID=UPI001CA9A644|nr:uncharacterized protein LOC122502033 [Leptopilina heterotoma]XP_043467820.1 uncharacterized protein LOC122502033 [Leptopilina heterotoma]